MKKIISIVLVCMLLFTGCNKVDNTPNNTPSDSNSLIDLGDVGINDDAYINGTLDALWPNHTSSQAPTVGEMTPDAPIVSSSSNVASSSSQETPTKEESTEDTVERIRKDLKIQSEKYKDTYGWIYVSGTTIDYPIAQSTNNTKYLRKNWDLGYSLEGLIFADFENGKIPSDEKNLILYGHNINSQRQFGSLQNLRKEEAFKSSLIYVFVDNKAYVYQPFAEFVTMIDFHYNITKFPTPSDFTKLVKSMKDKSLIKSSIAVTEKDNIITLSTCTNRDDNERYVVSAKLITTIDLT